MGKQLRSLAHPGWPYIGTPWEWRGFVASAVVEAREMPRVYPGDVVNVAVEVRYQKLNLGPELD